MAYNFTPFKQAVEGTIDWLKREYSGVRTGRATPTILDVISVEAYGSKMQITALANVSVEDPRTLRITPWDATVVKAIESAIQQSDLGLSSSVDEKGIRISFPELTSDRRTALAKVAKQKLEDARVRLRGERQKVLSDIDKSETGDDEKTRSRNDLQKLIDETNKKLEELADKKEKEILE